MSLNNLGYTVTSFLKKTVNVDLKPKTYKKIVILVYKAVIKSSSGQRNTMKIKYISYPIITKCIGQWNVCYCCKKKKHFILFLTQEKKKEPLLHKILYTFSGECSPVLYLSTTNRLLTDHSVHVL